MITFDANCFLGRWPAGGPTYALVDDLLSAMDRLGIDRSLVRHTLGWQHYPQDGNALLMEQLNGNERLVPCWAALPPITGELGPLDDWLAQLADQNVRAVCLYPQAYGYPLTEWQCGPLLEALAQRRYVLLLETSEVNWEQVHWLCGRYPALRVVLTATGYRVLRQLYALLDAHPNLYLDLSTLANFRGLEEIAARFGAERLLFGTGLPRYDGVGPRTALAYSPLDEAARAAIASGNLTRLLQEVTP